MLENLKIEKKIPLFLITGFLGSGKTTLLKQFIDYQSEDLKIGIVQNEFAPANVDGITLRESGKPYEILEVNKGSVFCVCLLSDFIKSLATFLVDKSPDVLIIEASGLSDPIAIAEMLQAGEIRDKVFLSHIWCIIDAENYFKVRKIQSGRVEHQVRIADTVLINKADLQENTGTIKEDIQKINPYAKIKSATYCNIGLEKIPEFNKIKPVALQQQDQNKSFESCGRPDIQSAVLRTTKKISREGLERFLRDYAPKTFRLKGFAVLETDEVVAVQSTFANFEIKETSNKFSGTMLIAMGDDVNIAEMNREFKKQVKK